MRILRRDGYRCVYCGVGAKDRRLEVDHIVPRSNGGSNQDTNLITACWQCNNGKGNADFPVPW